MKIKRIIFSIIVFLFCSVPVFSQDEMLKHYGAKEGLPSTDIYEVLQDSKGYIWFATNYGVSRFDGYKFENFDKQSGLADNTILELFEDKKGRIWFISNSCKHSYFYNDTIYKYWNNDIFNSTIKDKPNIINQSFYVDENDNVYFGIVRQGIYKISKNGLISKKYNSKINYKTNVLYVENTETFFDNKSTITPMDFIYVKKNNKTAKLFLDKNYPKLSSGVRFGIQGKKGEIFYSDNSRVYGLYNFKTQKSWLFKNNYVISMYIDYENNLWVGTYLGGVFCFKDADISKPPTIQLLKNKVVTGILCDREGGYWFTTLNGGVYYTTSMKNKNYSINEGLYNNSIRFIATDNKQTVWVASNSNFLSKIYKDTIERIRLFENTKILINSLFYDNQEDVLWIGTSMCVYSYKNGKLTAYLNRQTIKDLKFNSIPYLTNEIIRSTDGRILFGTNIGVFIKKGSKIVQYNTNDIFLRINCLQEDSDKGFWYGSQNGLYKFIDGNYIYYGNKDPLLSNHITFVRKCELDNSIWIATKGAGLLIKNGNSIKQILKKDGLTSNYIKHLYITDTIIWASSDQGLNKITYNKTTKSIIKIDRFSVENGLISNEVNAVVCLNKSTYVATNFGITVLNYNQSDSNKCAPPIYINNLKIMGKDTLIKNGYSLPDNMNLINIGFVGLSYKNAGNLTYKYRLSGINEKWVFTKSTQVFFPYLPSGEYKFEVFAFNEDSVFSIKPATLLFTINPPFWEEWWFISLSIITLLGLIFIVFYLQIRSIKRRNTMRHKLNKYMQQALSKQMNPHFIFNSLNSIQYFILTNDIMSSNKYLSKFARLMRIILENSQHQTVTLHEELEALKLYLDLEKLRFNNKFEYDLIVDSNINKNTYKIPPLLIQPYVENAIIHGLKPKNSNGELKVEFIKNNNSICCIITDNGIGRDKANEIKENSSNKTKSLGTKITGDRLKLINSLNNLQMHVNYLDLKDEFNNPTGTCVEIFLPLI